MIVCVSTFLSRTICLCGLFDTYFLLEQTHVLLMFSRFPFKRCMILSSFRHLRTTSHVCLCVVLALASGRQGFVIGVVYGLFPLCSCVLPFGLGLLYCASVCAARLLPVRRALLGPPSVTRGTSLQLCLVILVLMAAKGLAVLDALVLDVFFKEKQCSASSFVKSSSALAHGDNRRALRPNPGPSRGGDRGTQLPPPSTATREGGGWSKRDDDPTS